MVNLNLKKFNNNEYSDSWSSLEQSKSMPKYYSGTIKVSAKKFLENINNPKTANKYIKHLYDGKFILIKKTYSAAQIKKIKQICVDLEKNTKQSFFKMNKKIPNFWREIDEETSKMYSLKTSRTSWYFFRWNSQSKFLYKLFDPIWRSVKQLSGLKKHSFESNLPKDNIVDRIQIVRYPNNAGFIEQHRHPVRSTRIIISVYLSKKGKDYFGGGTYFISKNTKKKINPENYVDAGDVGLFYGNLTHGVERFKVKKKTVNPFLGRWWIGLYSPETDLVKKRHTSAPVKKIN